MRLNWETLAAAVLVAASILFVCRYQISVAGVGTQNGGDTYVYRLDRWTGEVVECKKDINLGNGSRIECPAHGPDAPGPK
jgi:hypothetical protein